MTPPRLAGPGRLRSLALAAALVGALAGLVAAAFATVAAEPAIEDAIAIEDAAAVLDVGHENHAGPGDEEVVVSRGVQRGVGLFGAYAFSGVAFGLLLAAASSARASSTTAPFRRTVVAGAVLAGAVTVAPWLKYPPNPPAVGDPATLGQRQIAYLALIVLTALVGAGAVYLAGRLRAAGWPEHRRVVAVTGAVVVPLLLLLGILSPLPVSVEVPATLVWGFRLASLGTNLLLWTILTLGLAAVVAEVERRRRVATDAQGLVPVPTQPSRRD